MSTWQSDRPFGVAHVDGKKLKAARLARGLTQFELGASAGLHVQALNCEKPAAPRTRDEFGRYVDEGEPRPQRKQSSAYVSLLERGRSRCSRAVLYRFATALDVGPTDLLAAPAEIGPDDLAFQADPTHPRFKGITDIHGTPLLPRNLNREFHKLLQAAGLEEHRMHDLRHSFATLMLELGEDIAVIFEMLGHTSTVITSTFYAHVRRGVQQRAAGRMDDLFSKH